MSRLWIFCLLIPFMTWAAPSQRAKCALECYSRCMQSGTPSAVYCNCPVDKTQRTCSSVEKKLYDADILASVPDAATEYIDSHTIRIQMEEHPIAFSYIFEYSTISTYPDEWYFAGASVKPTITFSVLDPCRDYQFRVIVVIRSTNPLEEFVIYRPRAIPVKLPPFALKTDEIVVENPVVNTTLNTLRVFVRWSLPSGYTDGDIHGYEAPALYPMQCRTPEEELPQPKIEIIRGGGRLAVSLPSSVLEARCRLWVEVKMLPRCVRLEPFSIQKSIDIDCDKRPDMDICSREANPVCTENITITGNNGKSKIEWISPTSKIPLYYHLRYGLAHLKGSPPFTTWQLLSKKDVKVDGAVTTFDVDVPLDKEYGVQVCAILSAQRKRPKFGVVPVTAFQCEACKADGSCGCYNVEVPPIGNRWNISALAQASKDDIPIQKVTQQQAVFQMETDLMVAVPATIRNLTEILNEHEIPANTRKLDDVQQLKTSSASSFTKKLSPGLSTTTAVSSTSPRVSQAKTSTSPIVETTVTSARVEAVEVSEQHDAEVQEILENPLKSSEIEENAPRIIHSSAVNVLKSDSLQLELSAKQDELSKLAKQLEEDVAITEISSAAKTTSDTPSQPLADISKLNDGKQEITLIADISEELTENADKPKVNSITSVTTEEPVRSRVEARGTKLLSAQSAISKEVSSPKCLLSNGIVCEFGCETRKMCICPFTFLKLESGACVMKRKKDVSCLRKKDLNATWDSITKNILVYSHEVYEHIKSMENADRLFVEFGTIREEKMSLSSLNETIGGFVFDDDNETHKMVVGTEKIVRTAVFDEEPFVFHVKDLINIDKHLYGMRLCTFRNHLIHNPFEYNWNTENSVNKSGNIVQVVQLSAIHFTNDLRSELAESYWMMFYNVGKITLLIVLASLVVILVYLNCSRIKSLYDRKRTHYFRPYYFDPQIHVTQASRYGTRGLNRTDPSSLYDTRNRMI